MRTRHSRLQDLQRVFEEHITIGMIAEPFASFDESDEMAEAKQLMVKRKYDVIGIRSNGLVSQYLDQIQVRTDRSFSIKSFDDEDTFDEYDSLTVGLERLCHAPRIYIRSFGQIAGIVTRADLEKQPVRLWLFGLISVLEIRMLSLVRRFYPEDTWRDQITLQRLEAVKKVLADRTLSNTEIDLASCLQFADKRDIILSHPENTDATNLSRKKFESLAKKLERLRNEIAHSNPISKSDWRTTFELSTNCKSLIERVDAYLGRPQ
jgi:hypothetical protein